MESLGGLWGRKRGYGVIGGVMRIHVSDQELQSTAATLGAVGGGWGAVGGVRGL